MNGPSVCPSRRSFLTTAAAAGTALVAVPANVQASAALLPADAQPSALLEEFRAAQARANWAYDAWEGARLRLRQALDALDAKGVPAAFDGNVTVACSPYVTLERSKALREHARKAALDFYISSGAAEARQRYEAARAEIMDSLGGEVDATEEEWQAAMAEEDRIVSEIVDPPARSMGEVMLKVGLFEGLDPENDVHVNLALAVVCDLRSLADAGGRA